MNTLPPHADNGNPLPIPTTSGIYKITCKANKKIYIGSALNLCRRKNEHFRKLRQNKHGNPYMQNAWNKYGEASFIFEVLELVLPMSLTAREQYWFHKLKPFGRKGFNIAHDAGSTLGRKHTPEAIEKCRQAALGNKNTLGKKQSPEHVEKTRQASLGRKHSPETREKMSQTRRGRKMPPEAIEKTRQANLGRKQSPEHVEKNKQGHLGKRLPPEQRAKISQSLLGNKRTLGYKHTPETREKMSQAKRGDREVV